jgi:hypothetical protein
MAIPADLLMTVSDAALAGGALVIPWAASRRWRAWRGERARLVAERRAQARWLAARRHPAAVSADRIASPKDPVLADPAANAAWDDRDRRADLRLVASR